MKLFPSSIKWLSRSINFLLLINPKAFSPTRVSLPAATAVQCPFPRSLNNSTSHTPRPQQQFPYKYETCLAGTCFGFITKSGSTFNPVSFCFSNGAVSSNVLMKRFSMNGNSYYEEFIHQVGDYLFLIGKTLALIYLQEVSAISSQNQYSPIVLWYSHLTGLCSRNAINTGNSGASGRDKSLQIRMLICISTPAWLSLLTENPSTNRICYGFILSN